VRNVLCLWLALASIAWGCSELQPQPGVVTGVVHGVKHYESVKLGPPIAGHEVTLMDSDTGSVVGRMRTDADGKFSFSVPPGKYSVWAASAQSMLRSKPVRLALWTSRHPKTERNRIRLARSSGRRSLHSKDLKLSRSSIPDEEDPHLPPEIGGAYRSTPRSTRAIQSFKQCRVVSNAS